MTTRDAAMRALWRLMEPALKARAISEDDAHALRALLFALQDAALGVRNPLLEPAKGKRGNPHRQDTRLRRALLLACVRQLRESGRARDDKAALAELWRSNRTLNTERARMASDLDDARHGHNPDHHLPLDQTVIAANTESEFQRAVELLAALYAAAPARRSGKQGRRRTGSLNTR